jgi:iron complex outermembrane receptor protein
MEPVHEQSSALLNACHSKDGAPRTSKHGLEINTDPGGFMFRRTKICAGLTLAFGGSLFMAALPALAQSQDDQQPQRVEITGSSIRRTQTEGALPVTTLTQADIQKTGATSVTDLIQMLPAMQGFVPESSSVNGGGGGVTTAAVHSLPSKYTLVLLDGQRVAPLALSNAQGGGFGVNLESIPLDAIERVEILTDGASATYGSDAIAGVVNFITKKNKTDGNASVTYNRPQHPGAKSWTASFSKGFGDLDSNGFNVLAAYSHDHQDSLAATQRDFSARGVVFPFSANGTNYQFFSPTSNTEPANLMFNAVPAGSPAGTKATAYTINPYYTANGNCGNPLAAPLTDPVVLDATGVSCRFNYAATVQDIPSSTRDSLLLKGTAKLGGDTTLWGELSLSQYKMTAQYAPSAQPMVVSPTQLPALFNAYVQPYLTANNLQLADNSDGSQTTVTMGYRSVSLGGRTDDYQTDAQHFAVGVDGSMMDWSYRARLTLSHTTLTDTAAGGYSDFNALSDAIANGSYDPVMGTGASNIQSAILHNQFSKATSDLNTLHFEAQRDLFAMPGGTSVLALGADYAKTHYVVHYDDLLLSQSGFSTQPSSPDYAVGGSYGVVPFDASRNNWGVYGEWLLPAIQHLEVTVSGRYDSYSKTHSNYVFDSVNADPNTGLYPQIADADLGNTFTAATGKISLRYLPVDSVLLRASYGTGFKAPNISDIAGALVFGGSTVGTYSCPFPGSPGCIAGSAQYDLLAGPNSASGDNGLKPEKSNQWTLGFRLEPVRGLSFGADLWNVKIRDQVLSQGIAEQEGFNNPQQFAYLFVNPYKDPAGFTTIAFKQLPFNGGTAQYRGLDWDFSYRTKLSFGNLAMQWTGTQMLRQQYDNGQGTLTDLGVFGPDQQVVFRTITNLMASLQMGQFTNTLALHYKSGYVDAPYSAGDGVVYLANPDGSLGNAVDYTGRVPSYTTMDWQGEYSLNKAWQFTVGIKNLFDRDPPFTLQTGGGGNQVGYDGRYADPIGRTYYVGAHFSF